MQTTILKEDASFDGCDCVNGDVGTRRALSAKQQQPKQQQKAKKQQQKQQQQQQQQKTRTTFAKYVWATGGHSAAGDMGIISMNPTRHT